jgi:hypothetical protein
MKDLENTYQTTNFHPNYAGKKEKKEKKLISKLVVVNLVGIFLVQFGSRYWTHFAIIVS